MGDRELNLGDSGYSAIGNIVGVEISGIRK